MHNQQCIITFQSYSIIGSYRSVFHCYTAQLTTSFLICTNLEKFHIVKKKTVIRLNFSNCELISTNDHETVKQVETSNLALVENSPDRSFNEER